jgi:hypothetical protein
MSGSTTGGAVITLAQACTDLLAGGAVFEACLSGGSSPPTLQQCETLLAVCTAQDVATIDAYGLCLKNLVCDDANFFSDLTACEEEVSTLSAACQNAGSMPLDGGIPQDPDAGGETTTTGGRGG